MIRLIALDLDGTLLNPAGEITSEAKEAIASARAAGIQVVLATGRAAQEAAHISNLAGCDPLAVALGGAVLVDANTGAHIRRWDIEETAGKTALSLCMGKDIELMIFAGTEIVVDPFSHASLKQRYPFPVFHENAVVVDNPLAYLEENNLPLTKFHADLNPAAYPLDALNAIPGVSLTTSTPTDFELVATGVDKSRALSLLALLLGVPLSECAGVGDSENDLELLQAVAYPIAMGNAIPKVKALACHIAPTNGENGVAEAIQWCIEQNNATNR